MKMAVVMENEHCISRRGWTFVSWIDGAVVLCSTNKLEPKIRQENEEQYQIVRTFTDLHSLAIPVVISLCQQLVCTTISFIKLNIGN